MSEPGKLTRLWRWFTLANVTPEADPIRSLSSVVVAIATAVMSYSTLRQLGLAIGLDNFASYLFPLGFDAAVLAFTRAWLHPGLSTATRRTAATFALITIATSVIGNSLQHWRGGVKDGDPAWWTATVIGFSALTPVVLGFTVHMAAMVGGDIRKRKEDDARNAAKAASKSKTGVRAESTTAVVMADLLATGTDGVAIPASVTPINAEGGPRDRIREVWLGLLSDGHTVAHSARNRPLGDGEDFSYAQVDKLAGTNSAKKIVPALEREAEMTEAADGADRD
jgi:hypothetical protein